MGIRHLRTPHEVLRVLESLTGEIDALFAPRWGTNAALQGNSWGNSRPRPQPLIASKSLCGLGFGDAGGGTRTPDTRIMIPLL